MGLESCGFWKAWFFSFFALIRSKVTVYTPFLQNCICFVVKKKNKKKENKKYKEKNSQKYRNWSYIYKSVTVLWR